MRRNTEHYPDPTFDEAYANIRREEQDENYVPWVYVASPYRGDTETERRKGLNLALQMLKRCKEMWVFGDAISEGMQNEIQAARRWNIPIRFFDSKIREVSGR